MRATVELVVRGRTIEDLLEQANKSYAILMNSEEQIPSDSEIRINKDQNAHPAAATAELIAYITIRTKLGA